MKKINASINPVNGKLVFTIGGQKEANVFVSESDLKNLNILSASNYDQEDGSQDIEFTHGEFSISDHVVSFNSLETMIKEMEEEEEF